MRLPDAAKMLAVSRRALQRMVKRGLVRVVVVPYGGPRASLADVRRLAGLDLA